MYLRVAAGVFAYLFFITAANFLFETSYATAFVALLMSAGLWWFALAKPVRERRARRAARDAALIARADAGHAAFLDDNPAAFAPPPPVEPEPAMGRGLKIAIAVGVGFALLFTGAVLFGDPVDVPQSAGAVASIS